MLQTSLAIPCFYYQATGALSEGGGGAGGWSGGGGTAGASSETGGGGGGEEVCRCELSMMHLMSPLPL